MTKKLLDIQAELRKIRKEEINKLINECSKKSTEDHLAFIKTGLETLVDDWYRTMPDVDARFELQRAEMRYLHRNGWHLLAGTRDDKFCCAPEDSNRSNLMTIEEAILEQKSRDKRQ